MANKNTEAVAVADVVALNSGAAAVAEEKQGSKCCGCCCDFRRAVVVMGIIGLVFAVIYLVLSVTGAAFVGSLSTGCNDVYSDDVYSDLCTEETVAGTYSLAILAVIAAVQVLFYIFQIVAAIKYNVCMLATVIVVNLVWFVLGMISVSRSGQTTGSIVGSIIFYIIFFALEIYPTAGLLKEIKAGTMSKETYPREAYSCCCQPNPV